MVACRLDTHGTAGAECGRGPKSRTPEIGEHIVVPCALVGEICWVASRRPASAVANRSRRTYCSGRACRCSGAALPQHIRRGVTMSSFRMLPADRITGCLALLAGVAAFAVLPAAVAAQPTVTVSGRVLDSQSRTPLSFLTVRLQPEGDTTLVAGSLTTEAGAFTFAQIRKGVYTLAVRAIGYRPVAQRVLVGELSAYLDLGDVLMTPEAPVLAGVNVTATADALSAALDKRTFTVAENSTQAGGSVLQAMSVLPGVTVAEDGKLQLRGSDKVVVLIDGKQTALTGFGSQSGLNNLPASAIERIEIINNPGARFDANASAGIINLVLRKENQDGWSGRAGFTGGAGALWQKRENLPTIRPQYRATPKLNPSLALNYRQGATNLFVRGDWLHTPTLNKNEFATRTYDDGTVIEQQVKRNRDTDFATVSAGVDHELNDRRTLSARADRAYRDRTPCPGIPPCRPCRRHCSPEVGEAA